MSVQEAEKKSEKTGPRPDKAEVVTDEFSEDCGDGPAKEIGGRGGPDPTRYGDWEKNGRCIDF
jgi:hypothetical protein